MGRAKERLLLQLLQTVWSRCECGRANTRQHSTHFPSEKGNVSSFVANGWDTQVCVEEER